MKASNKGTLGMESFLLLLALTILFIYVYPTNRRQINTTTSAIQEILSGNCRLACRQSENSGISGLSSLVQQGQPSSSAQEADTTEAKEIVAREEGTAETSKTAKVSDCVCESCPCALIEDILVKCSPATDLCSLFIGTLINNYLQFLDMLADTYNGIARTFECRATCRRRAQVIRTQGLLEDATDFNFRGTEADNVKFKPNFSKIKLKAKSSALKSQFDGNDDPGTSKQKHDNEEKFESNRTSDATLKPTPQSTDSILDRGKNCSRCIEKGKTCISSCPKADGSNVNKNIKK